MHGQRSDNSHERDVEMGENIKCAVNVAWNTYFLFYGSTTVDWPQVVVEMARRTETAEELLGERVRSSDKAPIQNRDMLKSSL